MKWTQRLTNFFATSLQRKLLLVVTVVVTLVMIAFGFYLVNSQRQTASNELEDRATRTADLLAQTTTLPLWNIDTVSIEAQFKAIMADPEVSSVGIYETGKSQPTVTSAQETAAVDPITRKAEIIFLRGEEKTLLGIVQIVYTRELLYRSLNQTQVLIGIIILALILLLVVSIYFVTGRLVTNPLREMAALTSRVSAGDYTGRANLTSRDEMSMLASAFNSMTNQLQGIVGLLEQRVAERTEQLRASADVGRAAVSVLNPDELLRTSVNLITDRFGFYYAAVFTLDTAGQFAVLREATGDAGRILKERGHKLEVGGQSMVGFVTAQRKPRVALDVGTEAVRFANPLLPDTHSEIALPLVVGDRVLGALDVQSTQPAAFGEESAAVLQSMADQIAVALNNAMQFAESQAVVKRARVLYDASREVGRLEADPVKTINTIMETGSQTLEYHVWWALLFNEQRTLLTTLAATASPQGWPPAVPIADSEQNPIVRSALFNETHILNDPLNDPYIKNVPPEQRFPLKSISVPINARGTPIGVLVFGRQPDAADFISDDLEVAESMASLAAVAIENHQLLTQARRAVEDLDAINRRLTGESWAAFTQRRSAEGVMWIGTDDHVQRAAMPEVREALAQGEIVSHPTDDSRQLCAAVPIKLRDTTIGALRLVVPRQAWNDELKNTLESIAGHVAQAIENARLLEETETRFARERALGEATDKIRRPNDVERILETAAQELARYLQASSIQVRLGAAHDTNFNDQPVSSNIAAQELSHASRTSEANAQLDDTIRRTGRGNGR